MAANQCVDIPLVKVPRSVRCDGLERRVPRANAFMDLTGQSFGSVRVMGFAGIRSRNAMWMVKCCCGSLLIVAGKNLQSGRNQSCGCQRRPFTTHGLAYEPIYHIWRSMLARCYNPNHKSYSNYGGRGIKVCREWRGSVQAFAEYMGPRPTPDHSLDRYPNNDGNYEPGNVRWATWAQQAANRRTARNLGLARRLANSISQ